MKFIKQREEKDCGVFCLINIINFYGGGEHVERLRDLSGTSQNGTTMLGITLAAKKCGLSSEAFEGTTEHLKLIKHPCILHVLIDGRLLHYVVYYRYENGNFIIGDPAVGIIKYSEEDLRKIWHTGVLLKLEPIEGFKKIDSNKFDKKRLFVDFLKADLQLLGVISILGFLFSILGVTVSVFSQQLIDNILPHNNEKKLLTGLILVGT